MSLVKPHSIRHTKLHTKYCPKQQSGFNQFELVVVIILISILATVTLTRIWQWQSEVEKTLVETVKGNLRSALGLETASLALENKLQRLPQLAGSNPFDLLSQKPKKYLGILSDSDMKTHNLGIWYYSTEQQALIYTIRYIDNFQTKLRGQPRIRFKIQFIYSDTNHNQHYEPGIDGIVGLDLITLDEYQWVK